MAKKVDLYEGCYRLYRLFFVIILLRDFLLFISSEEHKIELSTGQILFYIGGVAFYLYRKIQLKHKNWKVFDDDGTLKK